MREILFRGKRIDNGEWVEGYFFKTIPEDERCYIISNKSPYNDECSVNKKIQLLITDYFEVAPETVGQFTGLTDKDGLKIFEGDIVLHEDYSNGACITFEQFKSKSQVVIDDLMHGCSSFTGLPSHCIRSNEIEVVGNIHDNPELLK